MPVKAVLFDLDGTLLKPPMCLPQADCMTQALTEVFGFDAGHGPYDVPAEVQVDWTGQTDFTVAWGICERAGIAPTPRATMRWQARYEELFAARCPMNMTGQVRPRIPEALHDLRAAGYRLRVVTGNTVAVATRKLAAAHLAAFFDGGAYASIGTPYRTELVPVAMRDVEAVTLVGDTHRDMAAARVAGLPPIGIATERQPAGVLLRARAERVITDPSEIVDCVAGIVEGMAVRQ